MTSNCLLFSTYPLSYKNKPNIKYAFLLLLSIYYMSPVKAWVVTKSYVNMNAT